MAFRWSYKQVPNGLSLCRMALVFPFVLCIYDIFVHECAKNGALLFVFLVIIFSDIADGYLARKFNSVSNTGAALDIIADAVYTFLTLAVFAYFEIIPVWFILLLALKLVEFIITSAFLRCARRQRAVVLSGGRRQENIIDSPAVFFDKIGKLSICAVMVLPGVFVFRCIIIDYKTVMNIIIYGITVLLLLSSAHRIRGLCVRGRKRN
jgi:CDP-diacylglycerol--glycerol-3-phosphate 3-phosphatidyltransferase